MVLLLMIMFSPKNEHFLTNESNRALYGAPVHFTHMVGDMVCVTKLLDKMYTIYVVWYVDL